MFERVCHRDDIQPNAGINVLLSDGSTIAVFKVVTEEGESFYAISAVDPTTNITSLAAGTIGFSVEGPFVVAPIYKQEFSLNTGECLSDPELSVTKYNIEGDGTGVLYIEHIDN